MQEARCEMSFIVLNEGRKGVWLPPCRSIRRTFGAISLPKETQYDDGDREGNERHAVTDGVTHFDGSEEVSLQKRQSVTQTEFDI